METTNFKNRWTPEQTKANRAKWIRALESGEYEQGQRSLRTEGDLFCCLGVACDLFMAEFPELLVSRLDVGKPGWSYADTRRETEHNQPAYGRYKSVGHGTPPTIVLEYLGLSKEAGDFINDHGAPTSLASLNDDGENFQQIANVIRQEPDGLVSE